MKNKYLTLLYITFSLLFVVNINGWSQSEEESSANQSLRAQFQEMLDKAETYTEYKVIKRSSLSQFSRAVQDTLSANRSEINSLKNNVQDQAGQITSLSNRITDLEAQLAKSEELRESLTFLGFNLYKATYHIIVWVIIGALIAFGIFAYSSFIRSNHVTAKSIKEYKELELEFDEHKKMSHERQIKMGRELQTERNRVEELKTKLKAKAPGKP